MKRRRFFAAIIGAAAAPQLVPKAVAAAGIDVQANGAIKALMTHGVTSRSALIAEFEQAELIRKSTDAMFEQYLMEATSLRPVRR